MGDTTVLDEIIRWRVHHFPGLVFPPWIVLQTKHITCFRVKPHQSTWEVGTTLFPNAIRVLPISRMFRWGYITLIGNKLCVS